MTEDNFSGEVAERNIASSKKSLLEEILDSPKDFIPVFGCFFHTDLESHTDGYNWAMTLYHTAITSGLMSYVIYDLIIR